MRRIRRIPFVYGAVLVGLALALAAQRVSNARQSVQMQAVKLLLRLWGKRNTDPVAVERSVRTRPYPQAAPLKASLTALCEVERRVVQGQTVFQLTPRRSASSLHIIYTHGGAYVNTLGSEHWDIVEQLIKRTGVSVTVPLYRLAPESTFRPAFAMLEEVYRDVLAHTPAERVVLCGDSAGGGLALAQAMRYRDAGLPLPGRVVLFSPWLDITLADPAIRDVEGRDVMLRVDTLRMVGAWWAGGEDPLQPSLSPLYDDLTNLPPIDIFQGTDDIFIVDARAFDRRAVAAGADVRLYETPGGFHVFMGVSWIPEAQDVLSQVSHNLS